MRLSNPIIETKPSIEARATMRVPRSLVDAVTKLIEQHATGRKFNAIVSVAPAQRALIRLEDYGSEPRKTRLDRQRERERSLVAGEREVTFATLKMSHHASLDTVSKTRAILCDDCLAVAREVGLFPTEAEQAEIDAANARIEIVGVDS